MRNRQHSVTHHVDVRIEGLATEEAEREVSKPTYPVGERARDQGPYCVPQVPPEAWDSGPGTRRSHAWAQTGFRSGTEGRRPPRRVGMVADGRQGGRVPAPIPVYQGTQTSSPTQPTLLTSTFRGIQDQRTKINMRSDDPRTQRLPKMRPGRPRATAVGIQPPDGRGAWRF